MSPAWHLAKRFFGMVSATPLAPAERQEVGGVLGADELRLFDRLGVPDQRHALHVLRRFDAIAPRAPLPARQAALLHDIGKVDCQLGAIMRVVATVVGGRTESFRKYHAHEQHGLVLLQAIRTDVVTLALLRGEGDAALVAALRRADAV